MWRFRAVFFLFTILFFFIACRLFYWQVVRADELSSLGQEQYDRAIKLVPQRGEIKTADGYPIATNKLSYLVFANPKEVEDKDKTSLLLSHLLKIDTASVTAQLSFQDRYWVPIQSGINSTTKEAIDKLNLKGVGFEQQSVRYYPEASMAAHLIGFVGKNDIGE